MRWQPTADGVGQTLTLVVEVEDKAGNVTRSFRTIKVVAAAGPPRLRAAGGEAPVSGGAADRAQARRLRRAAVRPRAPAGATAPAIRIACVSRRTGSCARSRPAEGEPDGAKATIRVIGRKRRAVASGRGSVRVRLKGKVRRGARVEVRYTAGKTKGRAVVRLGKAVTVGAKR